MQVSNAYVYLVHRVSASLPIHCTDLIGKVGKGTGKRMDAYRTPYGSDNLTIDIWECSTEQDALDLEAIILDILDMRGWLRYHAPKNNKKANRAEVVSFAFNGKTQSKMILEYTNNMNWIDSLISYYHGQQNSKNISPAWNSTRDIVKTLKGKMANSTINRENLSLFSPLNQSSPLKNLELFFNGSVSLKYNHDTVTVSIAVKKEKKCSIM